MEASLRQRFDRFQLTAVKTKHSLRTLSTQEKKRYIDAVLCIRSVKPALYQDEVRGTNSRYDDFQAVHINQSFIVHLNAPFLAWHRWFTWTYEEALRHECGYKGSQPYWDWSLDAHDIEASPVFDGSDISMGGNGVAVPHGDGHLGISLPGTPSSVLIVPAGTGGGCVTTGPFANTTVAFGQVGSDLTADLLNNPHNLDYKPHCLRRDLTPRLAEPALNPDKVRAILNSPNITVFQKLLNAGDTPGIPGLHRSGHLSIGGEASDFFSSPGDPVFYLHHAQIDRLWTLWQQLDPKARQYALDGTGTVLNYPPSPVFQLNDTINLGKLSPKGPRPIREFMSTVQGPFCYEYA
ncbi:hypothetical protein MMC22_006967 [Lobaria immixta]|nr:hypothetical protein [Lobaria immixta]